MLFVLSRLYGGSTITSRIVQVVNKIGCIVPIYLFLDYEDYQTYRVPKIFRINILEPNIIVFKKYKENIKGSFDILFFQSETLPLSFYKMLKRFPVALALDSTPSLVYQMSKKYASKDKIFKRLLRKIKVKIEIVFFRKVFSYIDFFLPRTKLVANDLRTTYGVPVDRLEITYCPHDLSIWKPRETKRKDKFVLLFVGNDWKRKGGNFLLSIYERYLSGCCILKIVSNDPSLPNGSMKDGVEVIKGITHEKLEELIQIYSSADLFVFPTRYDTLGIVLTEAACMGLPIIARDIGAQREIVINNYNGYLMPYNSSPKEWAERIIYLVNNPEVLKKFSYNSRKLAEEKFSMEKFSAKIKKVIDFLIQLRSLYK